MVFDLGRAMRKKGEFESARLVDFEFRRRVRATRLLLEQLNLMDADFTDIVTSADEEASLTQIASWVGDPLGDVSAAYARCLSIAHTQLVEERGDPTPHRLG